MSLSSFTTRHKNSKHEMVSLIANSMEPQIKTDIKNDGLEFYMNSSVDIYIKKKLEKMKANGTKIKNKKRTINKIMKNYKKDKEKLANWLSCNDFLDLLESAYTIATSSPYNFKYSNALSILARNKTGNERIDRENEKLSETYDEMRRKDAEGLTKEKLEKTKDKIKAMKRSRYYKLRKTLRSMSDDPREFLFPDTMTIVKNSRGVPGSFPTFDDVFIKLRFEAKKVAETKIEYKHSNQDLKELLKKEGLTCLNVVNSPNYSKFNIPYEELIDDTFHILIFSHSVSNYKISLKEQIEKDRYVRELVEKGEKLYNELFSLHSEFQRSKTYEDLKRVDALNERLRAIDHALSATQPKEQMKRTIKFLKDARKKCENELNSLKNSVEAAKKYLEEFRKKQVELNDVIKKLKVIEEYQKLRLDLDEIRNTVHSSLLEEGYTEDKSDYYEEYERRMRTVLTEKGYSYTDLDLVDPKSKGVITIHLYSQVYYHVREHVKQSSPELADDIDYIESLTIRYIHDNYPNYSIPEEVIKAHRMELKSNKEEKDILLIVMEKNEEDIFGTISSIRKEIKEKLAVRLENNKENNAGIYESEFEITMQAILDELCMPYNTSDLKSEQPTKEYPIDDASYERIFELARAIVDQAHPEKLDDIEYVHFVANLWIKRNYKNCVVPKEVIERLNEKLLENEKSDKLD